MRGAAARRGLEAEAGGLRVAEVASDMVSVAEEGLKRRGLDEEAYLLPLKRRLERMSCPSDAAERVFLEDGIGGLIEFCGISL